MDKKIYKTTIPNENSIRLSKTFAPAKVTTSKRTTHYFYLTMKIIYRKCTLMKPSIYGKNTEPQWNKQFL